MYREPISIMLWMQKLEVFEQDFIELTLEGGAMSNSLYSWHSEVMTMLEMRDIAREIEEIRLIKDAGLSNPGLLERIGMKLGNALVKRGQHLYEKYTSPRQAYQDTSCKFAA